jgi:putative transposase
VRQAENDTPVANVCRQLGGSEARFYVWKKNYGELCMTELRELRQLRYKNSASCAWARLDPEHILCEVVREKL